METELSVSSFIVFFMVIISIAAPSKTGKTTFLEALIPLLCAKKIRVGALKHCHHPLSKNPNSDSERLKKAGANPSIATNAQEISLILPHFQDCTLLLVEGFRRAQLPSLLLQRGDLDPTWNTPQNIIARINITDQKYALTRATTIIDRLLFAK